MRLSDRIDVLSDAELLITLFGIKNSGHALLAVRKLRHMLKNYQYDHGEQVSLKPVFGIALWPDAAATGDALIQLAGLAKEAAREQHEDFVFSTPESRSDELFRLNIEQEIVRALDNDEFVLHYQPQISLKSGAVVGAEALLRWNHPQQGMLSPGRFIPLVEKSGAIHALTRWCLYTALRELRSCSTHFGSVGVSVNVSSRNLAEPSFREVIANALSLWSVPPEMLTLEITEGALLEDIEYATAMLDSLQQLGVRISIDDFGTGYSSLAYLKHLPVDELKIDQSFVRNFLSERQDRSIIETIIKISKDFGFMLVAEGIERNEVRERLSAMGCEYGQGNAISRPLPHGEFCRWLSTGNT